MLGQGPGAGMVLRVVLVDEAKAAKGPFVAVEVAVVVFIPGDEATAPNVADLLLLVNDRDVRGEMGAPVAPALPVAEVMRGRGVVGKARLAPHSVVDGKEQAGRDPVRQGQVPEGRGGIARQRRRPGEAGGAVAEQVEDLHGSEVVDVGHGAPLLLDEAVPGGIAPEADLPPPQVEQVRSAAPVDVCQADATRIKGALVIEGGRVGHHDPFAEPPESEMGQYSTRSLST